MKRFLIILIDMYRFCYSVFSFRTCRFYPTCSEYAKESLKLHGLFKGIFLIVFRLLRCNPFCKGGYDPIPKK